MTVYVVAYDLNKEGQNYPKLIARIKQWRNHCKALESTWLISTNKTAGDIRDDLKAYIDKNDELAVFRIGGDGGRWATTSAVSDEAVAFLKEHI